MERAHESGIYIFRARGGSGRRTLGYRGPGLTVEAQKLGTQQPQSLRVTYRESQHYLALIRFPTLGV